MDLKELEKLLKDFKDIDIKNSSSKLPYLPTFMEITGYPHFENVCSNILKFFFLTDEVHGLKDLLFRALLKSIDRDVKDGNVVQDVVREKITHNRKYIDILITTDRLMIAIENKIYADLYNDINEYSDFIKNNAKVSQEPILIVLSLFPVKNQMSKPGPYYILYKDFMKNIDDLKMDYEKEANKKYWMLLEDFMLTISSLEGNMKMDTELKEFLAHNQDNVEKLLKRINEAKKYNKQIAQNVRARINFDENRYTQWIWNDANLLAAVLVHDLLEVDAKIAIDTTFNLDEQSIFLFVRNPRNKTIKDNYQLKDWLIKKGIKDQDITYRQDKDILQYKNKFNNTNDLASNLNELLSLLK